MIRSDDDLAEIYGTDTDYSDGISGEEETETEPELVLRFASLPVFVEAYALPNWVHRMSDNGARWCTRWWEHAEAVTRLEALWESFEVARTQPAPALSTWLRDHFGPHMEALTVPHGTFWGCGAQEHQEIHSLAARWATVPPPSGMFPVDETATIQP